MSANNIHIYHLGTDALTKRTHGACLMSQLALKGDFTTLELWSISCCHMSKGIFFLINICDHQGTHDQQSETDTDTAFNMIHDFNWTRKHQTTVASWRMWKKAIIKLCDENKIHLRAPLGKCTLGDNQYINNC